MHCLCFFRIPEDDGSDLYAFDGPSHSTPSTSVSAVPRKKAKLDDLHTDVLQQESEKINLEKQKLKIEIEKLGLEKEKIELEMDCLRLKRGVLEKLSERLHSKTKTNKPE